MAIDLTGDRAVTALAAGLVGYATAALLIRVALRAPPRRLIRTNVSGAALPAVLGGPLALGGLLGVAGLAVAAAAGWHAASAPRAAAAVAVCLAIATAAGRWDDLKGDERPRGFRGHLGAARRGVVTGGAVKLVAGLIVGAAAGSLVADGWSVAIAAIVIAGTANLVNLADRAPGRAGKVVLLATGPLVLLGPSAWTVAAAATIGALTACVAVDLRAQAMLGDAGANPLGAVLGVGLAMAFDGPELVVVAAVVAGLNLASERWSFSQVIDSTPWLAALDGWGRQK